MEPTDDNRVKQIVIGSSVLIALTLGVSGTILGWRLLPGLLGEWIGTMVGVMTTPFFLEGSFFALGLVTVITLNHWRQKRDGDEFVYLDRVEGPDVPVDLPDRSSWAVYKEVPLPPEAPSLLSRAEGAFEIGDHPAALEFIATMGDDELKQLATLELRRKLARAAGKTDLARRLEEEIAAWRDRSLCS